ncbi:putative Ig domain-containing protein, partial [Methylobacterium hispanicum]
QVRVTDVDRRVALTDVFAIAVSSPLRLSVAAILPGTSGSVFLGKASAQGGRAPYIYTVAAGQLPTGLSLNRDDGSITGTPPNPTDQTLTLRVADADGRTDSAATRIVVSGSLEISGPDNLYGMLGANFASKVAASGGTAPYTFSLVAGRLPTGLTLASDGRMFGYPSSAGVLGGIQIQVMDTAGATKITPTFAITIDRALQILGSFNEQAARGQDYLTNFTAVNGRGPYVYAMAEGQLPPGLTLDAATGAISGKPTQVACYRGLTVAATDSLGRRTVSSPVGSICVRDAAVITGTPAAYGAVYKPYTARFDLSLNGSYTVALASGGLPPGLNIYPGNADVTNYVRIDGTPTRKGTYGGISFKVTNNVTKVTSVSDVFSITISDMYLTLSQQTGLVLVGQQASATLKVSGGVAPYTFALAGEPLAAGFTMTTTRDTVTLSGAPAQLTRSTVRVVARDASEQEDIQDVSLAVGLNPDERLAINGGYQTITGNGDYSSKVTVTGGRPPYKFHQPYGPTDGSLGSIGLTLNEDTGVISGRVSVPYWRNKENRIFTIIAKDADGDVQSTGVNLRAFEQNDYKAAFDVSSYDLAVGDEISGYVRATRGGSYKQLHTFANGLPPGVGIYQINDGEGIIYGRPTKSGVFNVTCGYHVQGTTTNCDNGFQIFVRDAGAKLPTNLPVPVASGIFERKSGALHGTGYFACCKFNTPLDLQVFVLKGGRHGLLRGRSLFPSDLQWDMRWVPSSNQAADPPDMFLDNLSGRAYGTLSGAMAVAYVPNGSGGRMELDVTYDLVATAMSLDGRITAARVRYKNMP